MVTDKIIESGEQDLADVKKAAERRLRRITREEDKLSLTTQRDAKTVDFSRKLNFLVERQQSRNTRIEK